MRIFPIYAPRMIAKHARVFRDGVVLVKHVGRLEFKAGRFIMPVRSLPKVREVINELNDLLQPDAAAAT
ncbi:MULTISPECIES: DUF1107 family protein [Ferrimonas]|uniref:DUF1107 domain-containing protein n=1 Tax=Ferrimonas sediminum TaxID=718193 RepID=A0A1G8JXU3_9GAMM|nr:MULTISPECIES: DUF1107 family protein [Ferrimonas]USD37384.1 DUF1107 family protein [Ferrimonas sp. SCSIO 43195]SDI36001.1 Protein of unknown function [Ferrimonas sediminum]